MDRIRRPALATLAAALAVACAGSPSDPEAYEADPQQRFELFKETALGHYANDDLVRAESQALKALEIEPDDEQLQLLVAWVELRRGQPENLARAEAWFRGLDSDEDYRAALGLATTCERLGQGYDEAVLHHEFGRRDLVEEGLDPDALRRKSRAYWDESVELYEQVLELRPDERKAIAGLVRVYAHREQYPESLAMADRLIEMTAGEIEFFEKQLQRADLAQLEEARLRRNKLELEDHWIATLLAKAPIQVRLGEDLAAIGTLSQVLAIDPRNADASSLRGQLYLDAGRYEEAIIDLNMYLASTPDLPFDHPNVVRAYDLLQEAKNGINRVSADG